MARSEIVNLRSIDVHVQATKETQSRHWSSPICAMDGRLVTNPIGHWSSLISVWKTWNEPNMTLVTGRTPVYSRFSSQQKS